MYLKMEVTGRALRERRGSQRKEFGQPALQDIIDILVTSRPTQFAKKISASIMNSATELMEESRDDLETEANLTLPRSASRSWEKCQETTWRQKTGAPFTECVKELAEVPGIDL